MTSATPPDLPRVLAEIGRAGRRLRDLRASEGAAGNISVCLRHPIAVSEVFPLVEPFDLPDPAPGLANATIIASGSGRRLGELERAPLAGLGCVVLDEAGTSATLHTSPERRFERITSEFNSHLAVHADQLAGGQMAGERRLGGQMAVHAVVHAQPIHLTHLSHHPEYQTTRALSTRLLRWQPELIVQLPEGIGYLPFLVPGSVELKAASVTSLRTHRIIVWAKHGVLARSDRSVGHAVDLIDYAETGATYEHLDRATGTHGQGLTTRELLAVCDAFGIEQQLFPPRW